MFIENNRHLLDAYERLSICNENDRCVWRHLLDAYERLSICGEDDRCVWRHLLDAYERLSICNEDDRCVWRHLLNTYEGLFIYIENGRCVWRHLLNTYEGLFIYIENDRCVQYLFNAYDDFGVGRLFLRTIGVSVYTIFISGCLVNGYWPANPLMLNVYVIFPSSVPVIPILKIYTHQPNSVAC